LKAQGLLDEKKTDDYAELLTRGGGRGKEAVFGYAHALEERRSTTPPKVLEKSGCASNQEGKSLAQMPAHAERVAVGRSCGKRKRL